MYIVVLTPVFDDWLSAGELLKRLDAAFAPHDVSLSVLLVDDGSTERSPRDFGTGPFSKLGKVEILRLKKNLGHQRALAAGLCHIAAKVECDGIVVMDCDGEDHARDAVRLVDKLIELQRDKESVEPIVFAERTRRSEGINFQLGYLAYQILHYMLTGRRIRFGNFSVIPRVRLAALVVEPMLWNHYAASVAGSRLPYTTIPTHRGVRIAGKSRLGFVKLVIHGLSALSCYNETIGVRVLLISSLLLIFSLPAVFAILSLRFVGDVALPGWTLLLVGIVLIFLLQVITLASNFTMQIISLRSSQPFLPARDYVWHVDCVERCFDRA